MHIARRLWGFGILLLGCASCGRPGVTAPKLERAVATTFANLIHVQEPILGGPPIDPAALRATARCKKSDTSGGADGAGSYRCTITWSIPGHAAPVQDTYDLSATTDGCYTATADSAESHLGGPTLKTLGPGERVIVTNLLYAFDGCFDPT